MNKDIEEGLTLRESLLLGLYLFIFIIFMIGMLYFVGMALQYITYQEYYEKGYVSRLSWTKGCELKVIQTNHNYQWMGCNSVGNSFVVENYVERRK